MTGPPISENTCRVCRNDIDGQLSEIKDDIEKSDGKVDSIDKAVLLLTSLVKNHDEYIENKKKNKDWLTKVIITALVANVAVMICNMITSARP